MFRLLFQGPKDDKTMWIDSDNVEHLRECRNTMLAWQHASGARYTLEPFIRYIGQDGFIRKSDGTIHPVDVI